jgi:hypothetical protein
MTGRHRYILLAVFLLALAGLYLAGPISQNPAYHDYADQRRLLGIPYFWNVISNLPMLLLGLYALGRTLRGWPDRPPGTPRWISLVLCLGIVATALGSAYYHAAPGNATLVWDRLPMTVVFMPLFALLVYRLVGPQTGARAFYLLVPLGIFSVLYWQYTEGIGQGDLRPYVLVQYFPMVVIPLLLWFSPRRPPYARYILPILAWYAVAKVLEHFDHQTYALLHFWSGHTLKHLLGVGSLVYVVRLLGAWEAELAGQKSRPPSPAAVAAV